METYEEVVIHHNLPDIMRDRFIKFMRRRFDFEEIKCQCGYASEWAERFKAGDEYAYADSVSKIVLGIIDGRGK